MQFICHEGSGFCSGVSRAVDMALRLSCQHDDVYILGTLVHNEEVEKYLRERGIKSINSLNELEKGTIIIRTHGEGPGTFEEIKERPLLTLYDATCPRVKKVQRMAYELTEKGYHVVIWGKPDHPEVDAILKWTGNKAKVVSSIDELLNAQIRAPAALISQTTQDREAFFEVAEEFRVLFKGGVVQDTLCPAVMELQKVAADMSGDVDMMMVIGSPLSSNTEKLVQICRCRAPTIRVAGVEEIKNGMFDNVKKIGIIAGASTPEWIIKEVLEKMEEEKKMVLNNGASEEKETVEEVEEVEEVDNEIKADISTETEENVSDSTGGRDIDLNWPVASGDARLGNAEEAVTSTQPSSAVDDADDKDEKEEITEEVIKEKEEPEDTDPEDVKALELAMDADIKVFETGDEVEGTVVSVSDEGAMIDMGEKTEALLPPGEVFLPEGVVLAEKLKPGDKIWVEVIKVDDQEGDVRVSHRRLERKKRWEFLTKAMESADVLEGLVKDTVKAGIIVDLANGIEGFMPGSMVDVAFIPDFSRFKGENIKFKVTEINIEKNKVILSRKKALEEEKNEAKSLTLEKLSEGEIINGIVKRLTNFGAFVDVGGIDGLVHISEISWDRIGHPEQVLKVGDEVKVKVLGIIPEKERISLSIRHTESDPWEKVSMDFKNGQVVKGKVTRLVNFGAFIEIMPGVEGLAHVSQVADYHVKHPSEVLKEGSTVDVKIIELRPEDKRISLSVKDAKTPKSAPVKQQRDNNNKKTTDDAENGSGVTLGDVFGDLFNKDK